MSNPHPVGSPENQFKPGQSGNPNGRPKSPYRKYTKELIAEIFNGLSGKSTDELRVVKDDATIPVLEAIIAAAMVKDRELGVTTNTDKILDRIIGKVHDKDASANTFNINIFTESLTKALDRAKCIFLPS